MGNISSLLENLANLLWPQNELISYFFITYFYDNELQISIWMTKLWPPFLSSYMDSEDEMSNPSEHHNNSKHVHYELDSSITSSNTESSEMEKYLDEAIEDDDYEDDNRFQGKAHTVIGYKISLLFEQCFNFNINF